MGNWIIFFGLFKYAAQDALEQCGFERPKPTKRQVNVEETIEAYAGAPAKKTNKERDNVGIDK